MATQKADYYETLDVPRNATQDDIKRAFRRLAMQYHPDRNSEDGAEARFKEINEAYEILSDAERRTNYDRFGHAGLEGSFSSRGFEGFGPFGSFGDIESDRTVVMRVYLADERLDVVWQRFRAGVHRPTESQNQ